MRISRWLALASGLLLTVAHAKGGELLNRIQPSQVKSAYGRVSEISFMSEATTLKLGVLALCSDGSMKMFEFPERVWVIAYATEVVRPDGQLAARNLSLPYIFRRSHAAPGR
jgi:hypothetical protein